MAKQPFGQHDCESEIRTLKERYSELFFDQTPFNRAALDPDTYLIIGRRGAGKTALCHYFSFQRSFSDAVYIDVDEPRTYTRVLSKIAEQSLDGAGGLLAQPSDIWEYLLWRLIIEECPGGVAARAARVRPRETPASILDRTIDWLKERIGIVAAPQLAGGLSEEKMNKLMLDQDYAADKRRIVQSASKKPIFLAIDTLEKYNVNDGGLMNAMAGLIEAAARMNAEYAAAGIHIKVFMSGEVFPRLMEVELLNPMKSVKQEVYMIWRSKDLLRLIAWRFHHYLRAEGLLAEQARGDIVWSDPRDVLARAWIPYFGREVKNRHGISENTFSYVLRHTQMRPRQLIFICNAIAKLSRDDGGFPLFSRDNLVEGIELGERTLAQEIINSYGQVYPGVHEIVRELDQLNTTFKGKLLDKRAPQSRPHWKSGDYSPDAFSRLVTELGIVGRVTGASPGYVNAEFSYASSHRLVLTDQDNCAVHPMFSHFLNISQEPEPLIVMPFLVSNDDRRWLGV